MFFSCYIHRLISSHSCELTVLKQDARSHIRKRAAAVKERYQKQDGLTVDNLTQCFYTMFSKEDGQSNTIKNIGRKMTT